MVCRNTGTSPPELWLYVWHDKVWAAFTLIIWSLSGGISSSFVKIKQTEWPCMKWIQHGVEQCMQQGGYIGWMMRSPRTASLFVPIKAPVSSAAPPPLSSGLRVELEHREGMWAPCQPSLGEKRPVRLPWQPTTVAGLGKPNDTEKQQTLTLKKLNQQLFGLYLKIETIDQLSKFFWLIFYIWLYD